MGRRRYINIAAYRIAVIFPCLNEELTIGKCVREFSKQLRSYAKIYVFDNNSTDRTADEARRAGAIVLPSPKPGKGAVMRDALKTIDADVYVFADGDGTYMPQYVRPMIITSIYKDIMVTGARAAYYDDSYRPMHLAGNKFVSGLVSHIWNGKVTDVMTGYRVIPRRLRDELLPVLDSDGFEIETELTIEALKRGERIEEIPVRYGVRPEGSKSKLRTYHDGFRILKLILRKVASQQ